MNRYLLFLFAIPCSAFAQTQFQPPGGLPLSTQVGTAKNSDGAAAVTLGSMQSGISANSNGLASLQSSSVSHDELSAALAPYETQDVADGKYLTQSQADQTYYPKTGGAVNGNMTVFGSLMVNSGGINASFNISNSWLSLTYYNSLPLNGLHAHAFESDLTTPTSSSATCTAGQFVNDANFYYVCTATNHWRRAALGDF